LTIYINETWEWLLGGFLVMLILCGVWWMFCQACRMWVSIENWLVNKSNERNSLKFRENYTVHKPYNERIEDE